MKRMVSLFVTCFVIESIVAEKIFSIPLTLSDSPMVSMLKQGMHPSVIEAMVRTEIRNGNGTVPVPLMKYMDNDFYGNILFGHPGQTMRVAFDTSWIDSWIPTISCSAISIACAMRNKYDPNRSPYAVRTPYKFDIPMGSSHLSGRIYKDVLYINQVNITNQPFAAVSQIPWVFIYSKMDGILGLNLGENQLIPPVILTLQLQKKIKRKVFSFYLNRNPTSEKGGTLVFGGVEPRHYKGNFTYVNVVPSATSWMFKVNQISIKTPEQRTIVVCESGCNAVATTGGNPIAGPASDIDDLNKAIKAREFILGRYVVDCPSIPNHPKITFSIGGRNFTLSGQDYVQKLNIFDLFTICLSSFKVNDDPADKKWYIGGAFMSKYYTTFDMDLKRIGFADAQL